MFDPTNVRDLGYIAGFDAGYNYVLTEIERYIDVYPTDVFAVKELLAHLKMEGKEKIN